MNTHKQLATSKNYNIINNNIYYDYNYKPTSTTMTTTMPTTTTLGYVRSANVQPVLAETRFFIFYTLANKPHQNTEGTKPTRIFPNTLQ